MADNDDHLEWMVTETIRRWQRLAERRNEEVVLAWPDWSVDYGDADWACDPEGNADPDTQEDETIADPFGDEPDTQPFVVRPPGEDDEAEDEPYDDAKDHTKCPDCNGSGWYEGLGVREHCKRCHGAGWL